MPPSKGGPVIVGGGQFNYRYIGTDFKLTAIATTILVDAMGNLIIKDAIDKDDTLTISTNGANIRITDPNNTLLAGPGVTQIDDNTVEVPFANITGAIQIDTAKGDDLVTLLTANGIVPAGGITYTGGTGGKDVLAVTGSGVETAIYTPSATTPGSGVVSVNGKDITFDNLEPVDISGMLLAKVNLANAGDQIDIANGFDVATGTVPALVVTGKSGGVAIEAAHLFNNTTATIDTTAVDGADTITVTSADNAHKNVNLIINTGTGGDSLTVNGKVAATGDIKFSSNGMTINADITSTTTGDVVLTATEQATPGDDIVFAAGVTVQSTGGNAIAQAGDSVIFTPTATLKSNTKAATVTAGFGDTDGGGVITESKATVSAGTDATLTAIGDITVGNVTAAGDASITSTAGNIFDDSDDTTLITATKLTLSAVEFDRSTNGIARYRHQSYIADSDHHRSRAPLSAHLLQAFG